MKNVIYVKWIHHNGKTVKVYVLRPIWWQNLIDKEATQ